MIYLKTFEGRFKGLDRQEIEDNIDGILAKLYDDELTAKVDWLGGNLPNPPGLKIHLSSEDSVGSHLVIFKIDEKVIDSILTVVEYLKKQWGEVKVTYEISNWVINDFNTFEDSNRLNYLGNLQEATNIIIYVEKVNSRKLLERLGIIDSMEEQVDEYMKTIKENPNKNEFKLEYKCDLGTYKFTLTIDTKIDSEGYFNNRKKTNKLKICLKDRNDLPTLFHEVKHLDFSLRKNGKTKNTFTKAEKSVSLIGNKKGTFGNSIRMLEHIFYICEENEFQSKYTSFYKDFDIFLSNFDGKLTTKIIRDLFFNVENWSDWTESSATLSWYMVKDNYDFNFRKFVNESDLYTIFSYIISENRRKPFKNPLLDVLSFLVHSIKNDIKASLKIFSKSEKERFDKAIIFFEKEINRKIPVYKRRMSRIVTLACEKYVSQ